ncbi:DNA repair protein RecO [Flavicella sediminum]|uniref:DNA repair protein RecO n=1 Tax=Flavicella sediminum TaxID=2585141 RepID=UPI001120AF35|nr:DNA repair protein RecO [Flavicella sediminum]
MQLVTKAIVLNSLKYGDSSLIVKCYTEEAGLNSYMLRGILKSKKGKLRSVYFQPLSQLELVVSHNDKGNLNSIKEVKTWYVYENIFVDFTKQSMVYFIAEMLSNSIREEEGNSELFSFLSNSLKWLDLHDKVANFHLLFLVSLTKFLGFYPDDKNSHYSYFSLVDGCFSNSMPFGSFVGGDDLIIFKKLLGINFDTIESISLSVVQRQKLLEVLIEYFELHLSGFKKPKSQYILKELFS